MKWPFCVVAGLAVAGAALGACSAKGNLGPVVGMNVTISASLGDMGSCLPSSTFRFSDYYNFSGQAGQRVTFQLDSAWGDSILSVTRGLDGTLLAHTFSTASVPSPLTLTYTFPESGDLVFQITSVAELRGGPYILRATEGTVPRMQIVPVRRQTAAPKR
jgi:hypothetical protein